MDSRERSKQLQNHELIEFKVDQKVKIKDDLKKICGGKTISGYVSSIVIDANGIWYELIYGESENEFPSKTKKFPGYMLEAR